MKTIKPYLMLLSINFVLLCGVNCKKANPLDEYGLPKPTQGGLMLFACQVNGENWVARRSIYRVGGTVKKDSLIISANILYDFFELNGNYDEFAIFVLNTDFKENTVYRLNDAENQYGFYRSNKDCFFNLGLYDYGEVKSIDGEIVFTKIDKSTTIVSGTFWFNIPTDKCGELKVTNGRFDINVGNANFLID